MKINIHLNEYFPTTTKHFLLLILLLIQFSTLTNCQSQPTNCSPNNTRTDCGYDGITEQQCNSQNCCWNEVNPNPDNLPWCYYQNSGNSANSLSLSPSPSISPSKNSFNNITMCNEVNSRSDCGYSGINQDECNAQSCCWSPVNPNPDNLPWCYYPNTGGGSASSLSSTPSKSPNTFSSPSPSPSPSPHPISPSPTPNQTGIRSSIHTTYHWHLEQPIYWPDIIPSTPYTYQKAFDSMQLQNSFNEGHPWSDLDSIFSDPDRVAVYQYIAATSIDSVSIEDMGASVSYSGELIENINSFAYEGNQLYGYEKNYNQTYAQEREKLTSSGFPKMDLVLFSFHHSLGGLVDQKALSMELSIHKAIYNTTWGNAPVYSRGLFPAEMAFSERMIPTLLQQGVEWVIVSNNHISRCCPNYPYKPINDNCDPPNPSDMINKNQTNWFAQSISRGCTPTNAYPYSFTPHYAQYIDPSSGNVSKIIVVPADMVTSWEDSTECINTDNINEMAWANDASHPMLDLLAHDGDNDFSGGYTYYTSCVQDYCDQAYEEGYQPTTVQQYLQNYPVDENDIVHVEDGAWVNAPDFGAPRFIAWNWPLMDEEGVYDAVNGWAVDERNWAVMTAAVNWCETAQQWLGGAIDYMQVLMPNENASSAELAWHFYLPGLNSGFMYYGNSEDMAVKPTIACNNAFNHSLNAQKECVNCNDQTPPSIWYIMRDPYNPGGYGMGSQYNYNYVKLATNFTIWTFVYDVSNVTEVSIYTRIDSDGINPINDFHNDVYDPKTTLGSNFIPKTVSDWTKITMTRRFFPIDPPEGFFYELDDEDFYTTDPLYIADEFYYQVSGLSEVLMDYYVEAVDSLGNISSSPIYHVYIGDDEDVGVVDYY